MSPPGAVVAYRRDQRFCWELERISALERGLPRLRAGGSYAVTGGLGGVGIELATVLARNGAGHIALIDAEDLSEPPDGGNRERRSRAERALGELRARGVEITMLGANVAEQDELAAALATFRERHGGINGVIHAAGRVQQSVLRKLTFADARRVMAPKVLGAELLAKTLAGDPLDFVVYCSSIDAIRGSFGQAAYCAANAFLDAHAQSLSDAGRPFVSVNWDVWQQVGMAAEATVPQALRRARAVELSMGILPTEGRQAFVRVLGLGEPQVLVSTTDPAPRIGRLGVTLDAAKAMSGDGDTGETVPKAPAGSMRQGDLVARISGMFGSTLDIEPPEPDADFFELGGDSLSAMRLVIRLREAVGVDLPFASLFDYPSAIELARFIEDELPRDI
jgi:acyl carrier protein/NADP-dependent 3-hydroxy acid dehydrogenase YdfG